MSTSRKLLKLPTLESPSPTLPKSPQKRVWRTRRVSETETGNVDEVAIETLVTDRFQTLLSEGKILRVKENSPVKENYSRMQSANISSAKLSSPNSKGLSINYESRFINRTSILLSPSDPAPELTIGIGPLSASETLQGTNTLIPQALKDGKTFGSSLFSTQEKIKNEKILGSLLFSSQEKMERIKDGKSSISGGISSQENFKRPSPLV